MRLQAYWRVLNENWYWYNFSDFETFKGQGQKVTFKVKNAQNSQNIHQQASGYVNMQILLLNLAQLLKPMLKKFRLSAS